MKRRAFLQSGLAAVLGGRVMAALRRGELDGAADVLAKATASGQVAAAVLHVRQRDEEYTRAFGKAGGEQAMFLLGSITKPICVTALMTLFDRGEFRLDDAVKKFIP